jgi:predicted glycogen debranching enzyme
MNERPPLVSLLRGQLSGPQGPAASEWWVTNGRGGFASGTVGGMMTRRYHGLLVAATRAPVGRRRLVAALDEVVHEGGRDYELATHHWRDGTIAPRGDRYLERFEVRAGIATWCFSIGDALLEKRVWMEHGADVTYCEYRVVRGPRPLQIRLTALVCDRDFHVTADADATVLRVEPAPDGAIVESSSGAGPVELRCAGTQVHIDPVWYRGFRLSAETERGFDDLDDNLRAATFCADLSPGQPLTWVASRGPNAAEVGTARARAEARTDELLRRAGSPDDPRVRALVLAADQFIVARDRAGDDEAAGASVIAGYPWFGDWGRDTMIALPGLTLATGRPEVAASILRTFAYFIDGGMIPNRFPDADEAPEYNTIDASLWYVEAVRAYVAHTSDIALAEALFPALRSIFEAHVAGTRHGIGVDPADGLLRGGEAGVQLTWMDAKVGDWVVTPRIGKPVEINALWINACRTLATLAARLGSDARPFAAAADLAQRGFSRFWNPAGAGLYDVLDGPDGDDARVRPNQIFAVSLPHCPLSDARQRAVVETVQRHLYTPLGLRSLGPDEPGYLGQYAGDPRQRDAAYHQGTAWMWLLGPFCRAHMRVHGDAAAARSLLRPALDHVTGPGLGTLPEICDGDPPHTPRGCPAQAWSVAEVLAAWRAL